VLERFRVKNESRRNQEELEGQPNVLDHQDPAQIMKMVSLGVALDRMNHGVGWELGTYFSAFNAKREYLEGLLPIPEEELEMFLFELTRDGYLQGFMHREGRSPHLRIAPDGYQKALDQMQGLEDKTPDQSDILDS
jgi:hypothetical protein